MKTLHEELRPLFGYIAAFSFVINLLYLAPAMFTLQVFDRVLSTNSQETLLVLVAGTAIALLILLMLDYLRNRIQQVLGIIVDERLSPPVVKAIVAKMARGPQASKVESIRDVAALRNVFSNNGLVALFDAPWAIVYVIVIWLFHPALGMGAAVAALFMLALAWLNDRTSRRGLEELQVDGRRAQHYVESSLRNAEVLQALGMTERFLDRWRARQDQVAGLQTKVSHTTVAFSAFARIVRQAVQILMLGLGAYLVLVGDATAGIMIATTILLSRAVQPVEQLVASWRSISDARAAYRRLRDLSADFEKAAPNLKLPRPDGRLDVQGLSYRVANVERPILANVSFSLAPGEGLAIIGPSAAGKSTLARLLTGIWAPGAGIVRLDGADIATWPRRELGPWIGYVPQDIELFDGSVADNIARLGEVDSEAVLAAAKRSGAHELILSLPCGYDTQIGEQGVRLSPGQRQRVALARALYGNPQLVVLDEPNANLDAAGEFALAEAIGALRKMRVTLIVVTHRPSLIEHVDKVLMLDAGRVAQYGPAPEVLKAVMGLVKGKAA